MTSRKEVADLAQVSEATVSRVLNNVGSMKEETKHKVIAAAKQLNYYPSALARSLAMNRSGNIGVILPYVPKVNLFSTYFFSEILSGIGSASREFGYDLLLLFRSDDDELNYSQLFQTRKVDALIVLGSKDDDIEIEALRRLKEEDRLFCLINQHYEGENFSEIDATHVKGSYEAVTHLIQQGYKNIAFINGPISYSNSRDRLEGYQRALQDHGLEIKPSLLFKGNFSRKSGYKIASAIHKMGNQIDAVFVSNDRMAIGLQQGLREFGVSWDQLPGIIGYDDSDSAELTAPSLSSVNVPFYDMGKLAVENLLNRLPKETLEEQDHFRIQLPTELIVRESSIMPTQRRN
ncbi:LacI family DNA-binding transcriptional regulator [Paenibacillus crassostreae]|uniref:LacI family transcriptional regulator n=1 Tax=Paenibacillus crassostreae TaxID=1763538 RepID=A0A167FII2_9BACL|nr:LacI family DNA-binding transcriptional regulator [Paenibacillus crassostreae]AOZ94370.1 LacI family transcriptional regulator [Paenibacillus crassostreae]OAB76593.1 LacI family transcriptional regulator [Paenibacillus crassostreae]